MILINAIRSFWAAMWEYRFDPREGVDAISFSCLGDFLFAGEPVLQSYFDSPVSRFHLPPWMRIRRDRP